MEDKATKRLVIGVLVGLSTAVIGVAGYALLAAEENYFDWGRAAWWIAGISVAFAVIAWCIAWLDDYDKSKKVND